MRLLIKFELVPWNVIVGEALTIGCCQFNMMRNSLITGYMLWEDDYGRGYISLVDGFRKNTLDDGPYYLLPMPGHDALSTFPQVSVEQWGTEANVFVYPMWDEAWCPP